MPKLARAAWPAVVRLAFALATLCALFAFAASRADAALWGGPEAVSAPDAEASASEVGVDANGDATAIWTNGGAVASVVQTAYRPASAGWEAPVDLTGPSGKADEADLAVDPAGDAVAVWRVTSAGSSSIEAAFRPAGGAWHLHEIVANSAGSVETPQVSIDEAGGAVVVWQEAGGEIVASYRPANGSWGAGVLISPTGAEAPAVSMDSAGEAVVVWKSSTGPFSVVQANTMSPGGTWSSPATLSSPAQTTEPPQVEVDAAGEFFALWSSGGPAGETVEVDRKPAGGSWGAPQAISSPGLEAQEPRLAVDPVGDVVAAWYRFDGSVGSVEGAGLTAGGSWGTPTRLSPAGVDAEAPRIAISPTGVAQVVWSSTVAGEHNFELSTNRLNVTASWKASVTITHEGRFVFAPRIGIGHSGSTVVVWSVETEFGVVIKGSTHDERSSLQVTKSGAGSGTVTSLPARIDCGSVCGAEFLEGVTVTLTATPASGSRFAGWSGACTGSGSCELEIGETQAVNAQFVPTSTGGGEPGTATTSDDAGGGDSSAGPASSPPRAGAPVCRVVSAPTVGTFVPTPKAGRAVLGVRATVGVKTPSAVRVTGTLIFGAGKAAARVGLGSVSYEGSGRRNLRFPVPARLRSKLTLGTRVRLALRISTVPDSAAGCATPGVVTHKLKVKVVKVFSAGQARVS